MGVVDVERRAPVPQHVDHVRSASVVAVLEVLVQPECQKHEDGDVGVEDDCFRHGPMPRVSAELRRSGQYCAFGIYKENEPLENLVPSGPCIPEGNLSVVPAHPWG